MSAGDMTHRLIGRLPAADRLRVLDEVCRTHPAVVIEHTYMRRLPDAEFLPGTLLGVTAGSDGSHLLLVQPHRFAHQVARRIRAVPAAQVLRIRAATLLDHRQIGPDRVARSYVAGEVLVGPPLD